MKKSIITLFTSLLIFLVHGQEWKTQLDSVLTVIEQNDLFDGQVLIAKEGEIVFHKSYGSLPKANKKIDNNTSLAVKSITKAFTAAAVLRLEQEGKIKLNEEVRTYFPEWPYEGMTIKNLMTMTSGLPNFIEQAVNLGDTTKYMTNFEIVNFISKHPVEIKEPGRFYDYKNSNFITLAALVEKVSGMSFEEYVTQEIIDPLGLENTYLKDLTKNSDPIDGDNFYAPSGDGNLYSTAEDLYKFEQSFKRNQLLSQKNIDSTFSKTRLADGSWSSYGMAWWVIDDQPETEYYIIGDGPNIRASIQRYSESNSTLIYIHNVTGRYWKEVYWVVKNIWLGNEFNMPEKKEEVSEYQIDPSLLDTYVGSYLTPGFGLLHISKNDGNLYLRPDPIPGKERLVPSSDTTFYFENQSVEWEFFLDEDGNVKGFGSKGNPESMGPKQ